MIGQGKLFSVIEFDGDLLSRVAEIIGLNPEYWGIDDPYEWEMMDEFIADAIRDYIRRYWDE
jgi:hypothetical protein